MTQIITWTSPNYIVQAADTRLTGFDRRKGQVVEVTNDSMKSAILCGRWVLSYAGPAEIAGKRTSTWLTEAMLRAGSNDPEEVRRSVCSAIETDVPRSRDLDAKARRLLIIMAGWGRVDREQTPSRMVDSENSRLVLRISNFIERDDIVESETGRDEVREVIREEASDNVYLAVSEADSPTEGDCHVAVRLPTAPDRYAVGRRLAKAASRCGGPAALASLLAHAIQEQAKSEKLVGPHVVVTSLPREGGGPPGVSPPGRQLFFRGFQPSCAFFGEAGAAHAHSPNYVCDRAALADSIIASSEEELERLWRERTRVRIGR
jgi:hypothetical protein